MKYGRLKIDVNNNVNLIEKIKENETLGNDYSLKIRSLFVKIIPKDGEYSIADSKVDLIIDNTNTDKTSTLEIDYSTPLSLMDSELTEIEIDGNGRVCIDYGF